jgi:hypothetical protein
MSGRKFFFDEELPGFHLYDIDFSLRVGQRYKVAVSYDIIIEHFSEGAFSNEWLISNIKYHNKGNKIPLFDTKTDDYWQFRRFWYLFLAKSQSISIKTKLKYIKSLGIDRRSILFAGIFLAPTFGQSFYKWYLSAKKRLKIN